jgi:hypothetical protein
MSEEGCDNMSFMDILDSAMSNAKKLIITTKTRGEIEGIPSYIDDFVSDPSRFGYVVEIDKHTIDTVFIDEILAIT